MFTENTFLRSLDKTTHVFTHCQWRKLDSVFARCANLENFIITTVIWFTILKLSRLVPLVYWSWNALVNFLSGLFSTWLASNWSRVILIGMLIYWLVMSPCKDLKFYDNPFWGKSKEGKTNNNTNNSGKNYQIVVTIRLHSDTRTNNYQK